MLKTERESLQLHINMLGYGLSKLYIQHVYYQTKFLAKINIWRSIGYFNHEEGSYSILNVQNHFQCMESSDQQRPFFHL